MIHRAEHFWEPESELSRKSVLGQFNIEFNYDFTGEMCASPHSQWVRQDQITCHQGAGKKIAKELAFKCFG